MFAKLHSETLSDRIDILRNQYCANVPFPHLIIDNFFDSSYAEKLVRSFPDLRSLDSSWRKNAEYAIKYGSVGEAGLPSDFIDLVRYLNSQPFIEFLQAISGIQEPLLPDPSLEGGGLHQIFSGGFLKMHTDFNRHPKTHLSRRINFLYYLNKEWNPDWGGSLVLSSSPNPGSSPIEIEPVFNRAVIFSTTDFSYHGHPEPLTCPNSVSRKSLAMYYYSNGRPLNELSSSSRVNQTTTTYYFERSTSQKLFSVAKRILKRILT